jgi:hypothetical protein
VIAILIYHRHKLVGLVHNSFFELCEIPLSQFELTIAEQISVEVAATFVEAGVEWRVQSIRFCNDIFKVGHKKQCRLSAEELGTPLRTNLFTETWRLVRTVNKFSSDVTCILFTRRGIFPPTTPLVII